MDVISYRQQLPLRRQIIRKRVAIWSHTKAKIVCRWRMARYHVCMEIKVADQRILLFPDQITPAEAKKKGWENKMDAFGTFNKMASFLTRPKDEDFELIYEEHRFQPFWHVAAHAKYVYDRGSVYQVSTSGSEVQAVSYQEQRFEVTNSHIHLSVLEHCTQEEHDEAFVDGISGKNTPELKLYLALSPKIIQGELEKSVPEGSILVPPQTRVSAIMRDSLSKMIKGIQADTILEESVEVTCVDLYYHPIYAYQYRWKSKAKEAILEIDALTGSVSIGNRTINEYLGKVLDQSFLFDIGADAVGIIVPGGSVAVKLAKKYIDKRRGEK